MELKDGKRTNVSTSGSIAKLEVMDHYTYHGTFGPSSVSDRLDLGKVINILSAPFELRRILEWSVELNPLPPRDEDVILRLMLEPVELVLARPMMERVVDFIMQPLSKRKVLLHGEEEAVVLVPQVQCLCLSVANVKFKIGWCIS